jgi:pimeloyl-ACP methyl ester carboxylesterase
VAQPRCRSLAPRRCCSATGAKGAGYGCPILLVVAETDTIAPVGPALRVAEQAPKAELFRSRGGHYGVHEGGEDYDRVINVEVEFLDRHARALAR